MAFITIPATFEELEVFSKAFTGDREHITWDGTDLHVPSELEADVRKALTPPAPATKGSKS